MADEINVRALCTYKEFMDAEFVNVSTVQYYVKTSLENGESYSGSVQPYYITGLDPESRKEVPIYGVESIKFLTSAYYSGTLVLWTPTNAVFKPTTMITYYGGSGVLGVSWIGIGTEGEILNCFVPVDPATRNPLIDRNSGTK